MDRGAWQARVLGVARIRHDLVTKPPPPLNVTKVKFTCEISREPCLQNIQRQ